MSIAIMAAVWATKLDAHEKLVLLALADTAGDDGWCEPSHADIAGKTSIPIRRVSSVMRALEQAGYIADDHAPGFRTRRQIIAFSQWAEFASGDATITDLVQRSAPHRRRPSKPNTAKRSPALAKVTPTAQPPAPAPPILLAAEVATEIPQVAPAPIQQSFGLVPSPSLDDVTADKLDKNPLLLPLRRGHGSVDLSEEIARYQLSYPKLDVDSEFRKCVVWNRERPRTRKTRTGYGRHLVTWLSSATEHAARSNRRTPTTTLNMPLDVGNAKVKNAYTAGLTKRDDGSYRF